MDDIERMITESQEGNVSASEVRYLNELVTEQAATIATLRQDLKVAQSQAIQARAQAVTVSAERDQLRADARELATVLIVTEQQYLRAFRNELGDEVWFALWQPIVDAVKPVLTKHAKYLEPAP